MNARTTAGIDGERTAAAAAETAAREASVIARILAGERELFHDLIRPYERGLYVAAYSLLQNEADAEDVAQESVIKAYKGLKSFRGDAKFSTWLMAITLNEARSRLRQTKGDQLDFLSMITLKIAAITRLRCSPTGATFHRGSWSARNCGRHCKRQWRGFRRRSRSADLARCARHEHYRNRGGNRSE